MSKTKQIILIGGAPTAGKSTMAQMVANYLNIPWISTDQIREIMRVAAKRSDYPKLFNPEGYTGERFLTEFSSEQIVQMEMEQGEATWLGIKQLIEEDYTWTKGFVIEGVNLLPHLITQDFKDNANIKSVFLIDEDADRIRDVVFNRGLWDAAKSYSDDVKEKEVEWVTLFSHQIRIEAEKHKFPLVEVSKTDEDLQAVLRALNIL
jgi:2-phosphoglycerate kinase